MTDVNAPLAIAIFSFLFVEFWGLQTLGVSYLSKFFSFGKLLKGDILGGIIDVFSFAYQHPYRIEFFDNTIERLSSFHVENQRSHFQMWPQEKL